MAVKITTKKPIKCPKCGSGHTVRHGFNVTKAGKYPRRKCWDCGTTFYEDYESREAKQ